MIPSPHPSAFRSQSFKDFFQKLEQGEWGHIFAEGAIRQPWRWVFLQYPVPNGCFRANGSPSGARRIRVVPGPSALVCKPACSCHHAVVRYIPVTILTRCLDPDDPKRQRALYLWTVLLVRECLLNPISSFPSARGMVHVFFHLSSSYARVLAYSLKIQRRRACAGGLQGWNRTAAFEERGASCQHAQSLTRSTCYLLHERGHRKGRFLRLSSRSNLYQTTELLRLCFC